MDHRPGRKNERVGERDILMHLCERERKREIIRRKREMKRMNREKERENGKTRIENRWEREKV